MSVFVVLFGMVRALLLPRDALVAENLARRQQLVVLQRTSGRFRDQSGPALTFSATDSFFGKGAFTADNLCDVESPVGGPVGPAPAGGSGLHTAGRPSRHRPASPGARH